MKLLIINGPNLNLIGRREVDVYGKENLDQIINWVSENIKNSKVDLIWFQSNSEGDIIDKLHWAIDNQIVGVIINPGAYTHYSYAIRDAISSIEIPTIEVHLSNIDERENFRKKSVIKDVCKKQIKGKGKEGYLEAIKILCKGTP
jgi:3-dehydroquinate dehydratase-2